MKTLIKLGGTLLDHPAKRSAIASQLSAAARKCDLAVVHGGGKQVTRYLEDRGIQSKFLNGLRVSDSAVIDAVTNVIAGGVNKHLVAALRAAGCAAVGISGVDGSLVDAAPLSPEMQFTGKPGTANGRLLDALHAAGYLPVIACIAGDAAGNIYNVNADQLAVVCAAGWGAERLLFLTDVAGVKDRVGQIIPHLQPQQARDLISSGVAHGGMQAKLESCCWALESGLHEVIIAGGDVENVCSDLLDGRPQGTSIGMRAVEVA